MRWLDQKFAIDCDEPGRALTTGSDRDWVEQFFL
jgi:hypothetical protein